MSTVCLMVGLLGCGQDGMSGESRASQAAAPPTWPTFDPERGVEPLAGSWRGWIVTDPTRMRPAASPPTDPLSVRAELEELHALASARRDPMLRNIADWAGSSLLRWDEFLRKLIRKHPLSPPAAARALALVAVAMHDAVVCAWDCKYAFLRARPSAHPGAPSVVGQLPRTPSFVSERAAVAAAAADVIRYVYPPGAFPHADHEIGAFFDLAVDADLYSGVHFRSDVTEGIRLGRAVAREVIRVAQGDGASSAQREHVESGEPGAWVRTPRKRGEPALPPLLAGWGEVRTWVLPRGDFLRPEAPPVYGSSEWTMQMREVVEASKTLTAERMNLARAWSGGPGSETPAGLWSAIACQVAAAHGLSEPRVARVLAAVAVTQHDAFVACWSAKYWFNCVRPVTEIRSRLDSTWSPYLETPPFPSYPSGHATTSAAASQVLGFFFPEQAVKLNRMASEARDSRLYGGIHTRFDNDAGFDLGRAVGNAVIARLKSDDGT